METELRWIFGSLIAFAIFAVIFVIAVNLHNSVDEPGIMWDAPGHPLEKIDPMDPEADPQPVVAHYSTQTTYIATYAADNPLPTHTPLEQ